MRNCHYIISLSLLGSSWTLLLGGICVGQLL